MNRIHSRAAWACACFFAFIFAFVGASGGLAAETVAVPEPSAETLRYYHSGNVLWIINVLFGFLVPLAILFTGLSAKIRDIAAACAPRHRILNWLFTILFYFLMYSLLVFAVNLPLDFYQGFLRPHDYGLSNQSFTKWFTNLLIGQGIGLLIGGLILWVPYLLLKKAPRTWWIWSGLAAVPFTIFMMLISPIWIAPLFNDFGPMQDKNLEQRILALADRTGIEGGRVFEVNKSVDTKTVNAYVTGFGETKRIVLWDTLLAKLNDEEVLFVMGHEMGHYVLDHVLQGIALACIGIFASLFAVHILAGWSLRRLGHRFGFHELSDVASLPLILLIVSLISFAARPALLAYSRHNEHESDRFALELTRDNFAGASAFAKLQAENLAHPRPAAWVKWLRSGHPPLGERIEFCNRYRPWESGEELRYERLFGRR